MISSRKLFFDRLVKEIRFQVGVLKLLLDWTVLLYIVIPLIVIISFNYRSWWIESPAWIQPFPLSLLIIILYLFCWTGKIRTFVYNADEMFLIKHRQLFFRLKLLGSLSTVFKEMIKLFIIIIVLLPFLKNHYELTSLTIFFLYSTFFSLKMLIMSLKTFINKLETPFLQKVVTIVTFLSFTFVLNGLMTLLSKGKLLQLLFLNVSFLIVAAIIIFTYVKKRSLFERHITTDNMERMKYINFIYNFSYELEKTNIITRKRPLLFPNSGRIFKESTVEKGFIELFLKVFLRNPLHLTSFFQVVFVTVIAIVYIPPLWMKGSIFIISIVVLKLWSQILWEKVILAHPLMKKYQYDDSYFSARRKVTNVFVIVGITIVVSGFLLGRIIDNIVSQFII